MLQRLPAWALSKSLNTGYWFCWSPSALIIWKPKVTPAQHWTGNGWSSLKYSPSWNAGGIFFSFVLLFRRWRAVCSWQRERDAARSDPADVWGHGWQCGTQPAGCLWKVHIYLLGDSFSSLLSLCGCFQEHSDVLVCCFLPGFARLLFLHGLLLSWVLMLIFFFTVRDSKLSNLQRN